MAEQINPYQYGGFGYNQDSPGTSSFSELVGRWWNNLSGTTAANAAAAQESAADRSFQAAMQEKAMAYNSAEAAKQRDWEQMMSSTAHQRAAADLAAAGINPMMAAGSQAMTPSGATASAGQVSGSKAAMASGGNGGFLGLVGKVAAMAIAGALGSKFKNTAYKAASQGGSVVRAVNKVAQHEGVLTASKAKSSKFQRFGYDGEVTDDQLREALKAFQ